MARVGHYLLQRSFVLKRIVSEIALSRDLPFLPAECQSHFDNLLEQCLVLAPVGGNKNIVGNVSSTWVSMDIFEVRMVLVPGNGKAFFKV